MLRLPVLVLVLAATLSAQVHWEEPEMLRARHSAAMAHDGTRLILFGGTGSPATNDTWGWSGARWNKVASAGPTAPSPRSGPAMASIFTRSTVLMFGGNHFGGDTWEWNGTAWARLAPAHAPPARMSHSLAYDVFRDRVVLFGGTTATNQMLGDTWEWDGQDWQQVQPDASPGLRAAAGLAFDIVKRRTVLFGGVGANAKLLGDTWEYDGATWTAVASTGPTPRTSPVLAYDLGRARTVLFGGLINGSFSDETWLWDGLVWTKASPAASPPARRLAACSYDPVRGRVYLFGGSTDKFRALGDLWEWDGSTWSALGEATPAVTKSLLVYDSTRRTLLLVAGDTGVETWTFDGATWTMRASLSAPPILFAPVAVEDTTRGRIVLYDSLWPVTLEWDGIAWSQRPSAPTTPRPPNYGAMAYDPARQRVVVFGGSGQVSGFPGSNETWLYDGASWQRAQPTTSPAPRSYSAACYDTARQKVVLFGGSGATGALGDTWEWDGTTWTQAQPAQSPPARTMHSMAWDSARRRCVLFGGSNGTSTLDDTTWEWDGVTWTPRAVPQKPAARRGASFVYDASRGRMIMHGGNVVSGTAWVATDQMLEYGPDTPAGFAAFGTGCPGSAGTALLSAPVLPWSGETATLRVSGGPASAATLLLLGASRASWGALTLPFALDPLGMPGCALRVSAEVAIPAVLSQGSVTLPLAMPSTPAFVGLPFYAQALLADVPANALGLIVSDAAMGILGAK